MSIKKLFSLIFALLILFTSFVNCASFAADSNETYIYNFIMSELDVNEAGACGILANIYGESRFIPTASCIDVDGLPSYGLCQWHAGRLDELKSYCDANGYDYTTVEGQMHFLKYELNGTEKYAYSKILGLPNTADGAYTAGYNWCKYFGRGATLYYEYRGNLAKSTYWPKYGGTISEVIYATISERNYYIKNNSTGTYITVPSHGESNGTDVAVGTLSPNNYFKINAKKGSYGYVLKPVYTASAVINIYATIVQSGKNVTLYSPTGDASQEWYFDITDGGYIIRSVQKPDCVLDISGGSVKVIAYSGAASQIWTLVPVDLPSAVTPIVIAGNSAEDTVISWDSANNADSYEVLITKSGTNTAVVNAAVSDLSYSVTLAEGNYTVKITSVSSLLADAGNNKATGPAVSFSVEKAHVHDFSGSVEIISDSTCTAPGQMKTYCSDETCGEYIITEIPVKEHNYIPTLTPPTRESEGTITMTCSVCGDTYVSEVIPIPGENTAAIIVSDREVPVGKTVALPITLQNASGINSASFYVIYDNSKAELLDVSAASGRILNFQSNGDSVYFEIADCDVTEVVIEFRFAVANGSFSDISVDVSYGLASFYTTENEILYPAVSGGEISIVPLEGFYGDANGDGDVTMKDVLLVRKYIAGSTDYLNIDTTRADVNGDGAVDLRDVFLLRRYIAGVDIKLPLE